LEFIKKSVDLTDLAIGIVVLGIAVTIGANILINFRDNQLTDTTLLTVINETVTPTGAGVNFAEKWFNAVTQCVNDSSNEVINAGNYSVTIDAGDGTGRIANLTSEYVDSSWRCTYTRYNTSEAVWDIPNSAAVGISEYGNWFNILVILGIAGLVLGLIYLAFGKSQGGGSNVSVSY
jgi:hypothetical protein